MEYRIYEEKWWWGESYTFIAADGNGTIELAVLNDEDFGEIRSLMVHKTVRRQGRGNALLMVVENHAKMLGLTQVVLCARKDTFLIPWYQRKGYEIYDENPEYSKGQTVAMNKYL